MITAIRFIQKGLHTVPCYNCFGHGIVRGAATFTGWICEACDGKGFHVRPD